MLTRSKILFGDQSGATIIEYALVLSVMAITFVFAMSAFGSDVKAKFASSGAAIIGGAATGNSGDGGHGGGDWHRGDHDNR